eukprot:superscaffoldBa00008566_g23451
MSDGRGWLLPGGQLVKEGRKAAPPPPPHRVTLQEAARLPPGDAAPQEARHRANRGDTSVCFTALTFLHRSFHRLSNRRSFCDATYGATSSPNEVCVELPV